MKETTARIGFVVGVVGGLAGMLTISNDSIRIPAVSITGISALIFLIAALSTKFRGAISDPFGDCDLDSIADSDYSVKNAGPKDIEWISDLQGRVYSKGDAVPLEIMQDWYKKNPQGFYVITDSKGDRVAHIDFLPIKESTLDKYKSGTIIETEIMGDCIWSPSEKKKIQDIYIESVIIDPAYKASGGLIAKFVLNNIPNMLSNLCHLKNIKRISAMAATKKGERNLRRLQFKLISKDVTRRDRHNMFECDFPAFLSTINNKYKVGALNTRSLNLSEGL